jgi:hypothetical protein
MLDKTYKEIIIELQQDIRSLERMSKRHPDNSNIYYMKAGAFVKLAELTNNSNYRNEALGQYNKAIELSPQSAMYLIDRIKLYLLMDKPNLAIEELALVKKAPSTENAVTDMYVRNGIDEVLKNLAALPKEDFKLQPSSLADTDKRIEISNTKRLPNDPSLQPINPQSFCTNKTTLEAKGECEKEKLNLNPKLISNNLILGAVIAKLGIYKTLVLGKYLNDELIDMAIDNNDPEIIIAGLLSLEN